MIEPLDEDHLIESLTAFADRELDAARTLAMWTYLSEHPQRHAALTWLRDQQQLSLAAQRVTTFAAPADLRGRLASVMVDNPQAIAPPTSAWRRRIGYAFAAAAGLAIGLTAATSMMRPAPIAEVVPGRFVVAVGRVHADCSRLPETMHNASFESTDATLATAMKASLGAASATPDLLAAGFRFVGADHCLGSRAQIVHLLYRSTNPSSPAAVSVFVQPDTGKFAGLKSGRVYRVSAPTSPFPTLAWTSGNIVYFLLADDDETEAAVLQAMHPTPPEQILSVASR